MSDNRFYVYSLTDPRKNNQPFYIGKGCGDRCQVHLRTPEKGNNPFKTRVIKAIRQVGLEPGVMILCDQMLEADALEEESRLIRLYGRRRIDEGGILTNRVVSGTGGLGHSPETRAKISAAHKGKPSKRSPEGRARQKKALSERIRSPEETEANIARCLENAAKLKRKPWGEARRAAYEANKPVRSEETRRKQSKKMKGRKTSVGMLGRKHSEETKQKMREARLRILGESGK